MHQYTDPLSAFAEEVGQGRVVLPQSVRQRAVLVILDCIGVSIAGGAAVENANLAKTLRNDFGRIGHLLAAGSAAVSDELDEGCSLTRGHPGVHVVLPALHAARSNKSTGVALVRAVVAGYEVAARLGAASRLRRDVHPHGTWGSCGGAVSIGILRGMSSRRLASAIRLSASLAVATSNVALREGATVRNLWSGIGSVASVISIIAEESGFTAPVDAPRTVFGKVLGDDFKCVNVCSDLYRYWYILQNYFKRYACCRHAHPTVDALRMIIDLDLARSDPETIGRVEVYTYEDAIELIGRVYDPPTPLAAKFSLPYIIWAYCRFRDLNLSAFDEDMLTASEYRRFREVIYINEDPEYTKRSSGCRLARVRLTLRNGSVYEAESEAKEWGSVDEICRKFLYLSAPVIGDGRAKQLCDRIMGIEDERDVTGICEYVFGDR